MPISTAYRASRGWDDIREDIGGATLSLFRIGRRVFALVFDAPRRGLWRESFPDPCAVRGRTARRPRRVWYPPES